MNIINILAGTLLLIIGRRLFWLFVGCIGFTVAYTYAGRFMAGQPDYVIMAAAIISGVAGALFAVFFQELAVGISGFMAGVYVTLYLLTGAGFGSSQFVWLIGIGGGIIGAVFLIFVFDWTLILLSAMTGASMIIQSGVLAYIPLPANPHTPAIAFLLLVVLGCAVQTKFLNPQPGRDRPRKRFW
ncbi:MAG: hypothetical protein AB7S75_19015 [Desulfococcaceae bacterium]